MTQGVYSITHTPSGRVYVGVSKDVEGRWRKHTHDLKAGKHHNPHLQAAFDADGLGALSFAVLEHVELLTALPERETHWTEQLDAQAGGFNRVFVPYSPERGSGSPYPDAVRAAVNARLHEKKMSRADLARATNLDPTAVTRALNGGKGGGSIPASWAAMLDALGLTLTAVPVEHLGGGPVTLPSDPQALEREVMRRVQAAVREALGSGGEAGSPPAQGEPGRAGGE